MDCTRRLLRFVLMVVFFSLAVCGRAQAGAHVLQASSFEHYVGRFADNDEQLYAQHIPNDKAWEFLRTNILLSLVDLPQAHQGNARRVRNN